MEESENFLELTAEMMSILDERLHEDEKTYLTASESIGELKKKYCF